jgi:UDP-N-acetylmuramate dehydrogenase
MSVTDELTDVRLSSYTTLRVGGPARRLVTVATEAELIDCVRDLDAAGEPVLIIGGGSNLVVGDGGFDGTVVRIATTGISADVSACSGSIATVAAGEDWDDFVAYAVGQEWSGLETLSGIPGLIGATPIQNVGAYGSDVSETIETVRTWDRQTGRRATFAPADCGFGYRSSRFKTDPGRYVVLSVTFQLRLASLSAPIRYAELARHLGVAVGDRVDTARVRAAVLELRARKGMVLDESDHDTWSAGSFFTNPVLEPEQAAALPESAPRFPADGGVKLSAAWLIEQSGFGRGFGPGPATLSTKHALALTNRGSARADDVLFLARQVRDGVRATFGIDLVPEPVLVGCEL